MNAELWASVGTVVATLALVLVPGLIYAWYVLEAMIGDEGSYERVSTQALNPGSRRPRG